MLTEHRHPEGNSIPIKQQIYITAETDFYTVTGLDLTKDHTFTIQPHGDTWWKAAQPMGTYKMAGFD